ncbi:MAG: hypothetical protein LUH14_07815 [Clostridiaceae bacterium]|nr:hypothetical protein [Clostridiaceae bacterium]
MIRQWLLIGKKRGILEMRLGLMGKKGPVRIVSAWKGKYSYERMKRDLKRLAERYPGLLKLNTIGKTADGRAVFCMRMGNPKAETRILLQAGMHGREWLNTLFFMKMMEEGCVCCRTGHYQGRTYRELFQKTCFYILPMVNPDGVQISQFGVSGIRKKELRERLERMESGGWRRWKSNARGVDLNRNYSTGFGAKWAEGRKPGREEYPGCAPASEEETKALMRLVAMLEPDGVVNYHETGQLIYYAGENIVSETLHQLTGYPLCREKGPANGNFGDWLEIHKIPWCTVETCRGRAPVFRWQFPGLWRKNRSLLPALSAAFLQKGQKRA